MTAALNRRCWGKPYETILDLAVQHFIEEARDEGFDVPDKAEGYCLIASEAFIETLVQFGIAGTLIDLDPVELANYPIFTDGCIVHYIVEVAGLWFDWTARQFDPAAPFPAVWSAPQPRFAALPCPLGTQQSKQSRTALEPRGAPRSVNDRDGDQFEYLGR